VSPVSVEDFTVCLVCAGLAGCPPENERAPQVCKCIREEQPRWPGADFNEHATLCWCCLLELIPSGSRWSSFYCDDCRELAREYNEVAGRVVFYQGRHGWMNLPGSGARPDTGRVPIDPFAETLWRVLDRMGAFFAVMSLWRPYRLRLILQAMGRQVPPRNGARRLRLRGYLAKAAKLTEHPLLGRQAAFGALCEFLGHPAPASLA